MNITGALGVALVGSVAMLGWLSSEVIKVTAEVQIVGSKLATSEATMASYIEVIRLNGVKQVENLEAMQSINSAYSSKVRELNKLKGRGEKVLKRQTWVEKKINTAFNAEQAEAACITGDLALCTKK